MRKLEHSSVDSWPDKVTSFTSYLVSCNTFVVADSGRIAVAWAGKLSHPSSFDSPSPIAGCRRRLELGVSDTINRP